MRIEDVAIALYNVPHYGSISQWWLDKKAALIDGYHNQVNQPVNYSLLPT